MVRNFRSRPVGWRGESHRHYLAGKGISTKRYSAYKGFSKSEVADLENFFGKNPRLKLKRDKGVRHIINPAGVNRERTGSTEGVDFHIGEFSHGDFFDDASSGSLESGVPVVLLSDVEDKGTLVHELEHATHAIKDRSSWDRRVDTAMETRRLINEELGGASNAANQLSDVGSGDEWVAHAAEERFVKRNPGVPNTYGDEFQDMVSQVEEDDVLGAGKFLVDRGRSDRELLFKELRSAPSLKSQPDVWGGDDA